MKDRRWLKRLCGCVVAGAVVIAVPASSWGGVKILNNRLSIAATAFSEWSIAVSPELNSAHNQLFAGGFQQGDLAWQRNSLQIEMNLKIADQYGPLSHIGFHFTPRLIYEGEADIDSGIPNPSDFGQSKNKAQTLQKRNYFQSVQFRDAYLTFDMKDQLGGDFSAFLGQQQAVWGESDGFRIADQINPLDLSWHYFLENFEDLRVPIIMARVFYFPHMFRANQAAIEMIWKPGTWAGTDFGPVYSLTDPRQPRSFWAFPNVVTPGTVTPSGFSVNNLTPRTDLRNSEVGIRGAWVVSGMNWAGEYLNGTQLHAYYLYTRSQDPVGQLQSASPTVVNLRYPRRSLIGIQFNQFLQDIAFWKNAAMVIRGEAVYTPNAPFQSTTTGQIISSNDVQSVLGFERPTSLPFWADPGQWMHISPPGRTTFFALQWFYHFVDKGGSKGPQLVGTEETRNIITFYASQRWMDGEELTPGLFLIHEVAERHFMAQPSISYRWGDYTFFTVGANFFWGSKRRRDGFFGPVLEKDEVYFKTTLQF